MILGTILYYDVCSSFFIPRNQNCTKYCEAIASKLVPWVAVVFGEEQSWGFSENNAPTQTSIYTRKWFCSKNIRILTWPAKHRDQKIIGYVWRLMVRRFHAPGKQCNELSELRNAIFAV